MVYGRNDFRKCCFAVWHSQMSMWQKGYVWVERVGSIWGYFWDHAYTCLWWYYSGIFNSNTEIYQFLHSPSDFEYFFLFYVTWIIPTLYWHKLGPLIQLNYRKDTQYWYLCWAFWDTTHNTLLSGWSQQQVMLNQYLRYPLQRNGTMHKFFSTTMLQSTKTELSACNNAMSIHSKGLKK